MPLLVRDAMSFQRRNGKKELRRGTEECSCIWKPVPTSSVTQVKVLPLWPCFDSSTAYSYNMLHLCKSYKAPYILPCFLVGNLFLFHSMTQKLFQFSLGVVKQKEPFHKHCSQRNGKFRLSFSVYFVSTLRVSVSRLQITPFKICNRQQANSLQPRPL